MSRLLPLVAVSVLALALAAPEARAAECENLITLKVADSIGGGPGGQSRDGALTETQDFFRLFMVPGMNHCAGGPGPSNFDMLTALEQWVEHGVAPRSVIATHLSSGAADRTRPLCPYPQVARWNGKGSTNDAAGFACAADDQLAPVTKN